MAKDDPKTLQQFRSFQKSVKRDLQRRIVRHQLRMARQATRAPAARPLNLLADGDSWFDYPLTGNAFTPSDIVVQLPKLIKPVPHILSLAHYGLAMTQMMGVSRHERLRDALGDRRNGRFDAILFSGGGNDLVGEQFRLWLKEAMAVNNDPSRGVDAQGLAGIVSVVMTGYRDLLATRDSVDHNIPIFVHAYDFALPTGDSICGGVVGPWLWPSLHSRGWMRTTNPGEVARGAVIVKAILVEFRRQMRALADDPKNNVVCVETQGTLGSGDWANELHPDFGGFRSIAGKFASALIQLDAKKGPKATLRAIA